MMTGVIRMKNAGLFCKLMALEMASVSRKIQRLSLFSDLLNLTRLLQLYSTFNFFFYFFFIHFTYSSIFDSLTTKDTTGSKITMNRRLIFRNRLIFPPNFDNPIFKKIFKAAITTNGDMQTVSATKTWRNLKSGIS